MKCGRHVTDYLSHVKALGERRAARRERERQKRFVHLTVGKSKVSATTEGV